MTRDGHLAFERLAEITPASPLEAGALAGARARAARAAIDGYLATGRPWKSVALMWRYRRRIGFSGGWWVKRLLLVAVGLVRTWPRAPAARPVGATSKRQR